MEYPRVFDLNHKERDWNYAKSKYGVAFRRAEVEPGQKVYRLVGLWEKSGPASLVTQVLDENGRPIASVDVALYWPGAPDPPEPPTPVYGHDWYRNFVHGLTNLNGDVGPGMGTGAYHGIGEGGPHAVWVRDPDILSDICEKLGMLAGTPHDHLDQKFMLMIVGENGEELPNPDDFEIVDAIAVGGMQSNMLYLAYPAEIAVDTDVQAFTAQSPDLDTTPLEEYEYRGKAFALGGVCADFDGEKARSYAIFAYHLRVGPDQPITPTASYDFEPRGSTPKLHVIYIVDWKGTQPPPPPPEPKWTMATETRPGIALLIGKMPYAGIQVVVTDPRGPRVSVVSGSKKEHGDGGWEVNAWGQGIYTVEFEDQKFEVPVEGQTVIATFEEGEKPVQTRLVSAWMEKQDADALLWVLEDMYPGVFALES